MNSRRSFFKQLAVSAAAFSILPAAETYSRIWKPKAIVPVRYEINPDWVNATYEVSFFWNHRDIKMNTGLVLQRFPSEPPIDLEKGIQYPARYTMSRDGQFTHVPAFVAV